MAGTWLGAVQFAFGVALTAWGCAVLDRHDVLFQFSPGAARAEQIRGWGIALIGLVIACVSPATVLLVRF